MGLDLRIGLYPYRIPANVLCFFLGVAGFGGSGRAQSVPDSLEQVYLNGGFNPADSLEILHEISHKSQDPQQVLRYSQELIELSERKGVRLRAFSGYLQKGNALNRMGNQADALKNYFKAAQLADDEKDTTGLGMVYVAIADAYSVLENTANAIDYYHRAIPLLRKLNDTLYLATALANTGDEYYRQGKLDTALSYFEESGALFEEISFEPGIGYHLGSLGMVYSAQGRDDEALEKLNECLAMLESQGDYYGVSAFLPFLSEIYKKRGDYQKAMQYAEKSLEVGQEYGLKEQIRDANLLLSELNELTGNTDESLKYFKRYSIYKDSINNIGLVQQMARLRTDYEIEQKQSEVDLLEKEAAIRKLSEQRQNTVLYITIGTLFAVFLFAFGLYRRYRYIEKTSDIIKKEKARSDALLRNILPEETAYELKEHGRVQAKKFESVSVLFADFVGFTTYSEKMSPEDLVKTVDYYFSRFDQVTEKYGLEKIKTMGDCYMCAGGLPFPTENHAVKMVRLAQEFIDIVSGDGYSEVTGFQIRVGIHTGPVVAGVVGTKKFAYDIWGDTVNIASRMESSSEPGRINVSEITFQLIKNEYECAYRGVIDVKNRGMMKMYFVEEGYGKEPAIVSDDTLLTRKS